MGSQLNPDRTVERGDNYKDVMTKVVMPSWKEIGEMAFP